MEFPAELPGGDFTLRLITPEEAPALFAFLNRPEVIAPTSSEGWTLESVREFARANVEGARTGVWCRYGILEDGATAPTGSVGLFNVDLRNHRAEIGYDLSPEHWGRGLMTRSATVLLNWAFGDGGFNRIEGTVMLGNRRSERVLEKLGFQREATMRQYKFVRGAYKDYSLWARLASDL
jgi:ribosomal-protein-alanine N-acetyltransferase